MVVIFILKEETKIKNSFKEFTEEAISSLKKIFQNKHMKYLGKKGKGFLEDTSNYHKGSAPFNERGILSIVYNISKW